MSKFSDLLIAAAVVVMGAAPFAAHADPAIDPGARGLAISAGQKADVAKAEAQAVGAAAAQKVTEAEGRLNTAISRARGAAFSGDRALERKFNAEASAIRTEIEELKKKAKHECAAFDDKTVQTACLSTFEKIRLEEQKTATHNKDKDVEQAGHLIDKQVERDNKAVEVGGDVKKKEMEMLFGHSNEKVDLIRALELGCTPKTTIKGAETVTEYECKKGSTVAFDIESKNISKFGVHSIIVKPSEGQSNHPFLKVFTAGLIGAIPGAAIGNAAFPNRETDDQGHLVIRHWEGAIGGAGLGFALSAGAMAVYEYLAN